MWIKLSVWIYLIKIHSHTTDSQWQKNCNKIHGNMFFKTCNTEIKFCVNNTLRFLLFSDMIINKWTSSDQELWHIPIHPLILPWLLCCESNYRMYFVKLFTSTKHTYHLHVPIFCVSQIWSNSLSLRLSKSALSTA